MRQVSVIPTSTTVARDCNISEGEDVTAPLHPLFHCHKRLQLETQSDLN